MTRQRGLDIVDRRKSTAGLLPYWSHPTNGVVLLEDGSRLAMARLHGMPHELCPVEQRNISARLLNRIYRDIGDDNITLYVHFVRDRLVEELPEPKFRNDFSRALWRAHYENVLRGKLYWNDWYLTLIVSPRGVPVGTKRLRRKISKSLYQFRSLNDRQYTDTSEIESVWMQLERSLSAYTVQRLGYRYYTTPYCEYRFSEIGEAMKRFLGLRGAVPITTGRLGNSIYTDAEQPIFERRIFRIMPPGADDDSDDAEGVRWGALFALKDYMEETGPDLFDALLSLDMPVVVSQYFSFSAKPDAVAHLTRTARQMKASKDAATKQRKGLKKAASKTQGGEEARGEHDCEIAVYGPSYSGLLKNAAVARAALVNTGAQLEQETGANLSAYFGQLPGNFSAVSHPGKLGSSDFVNFANFGAFPRGAKQGKWGPAMLRFPTTAMTPYDFVPHVGGVAMMAIFGITGYGKTVLLTLLMAMIDQYMVGNNGIIIVFDKDDGCKIFIESIDGNYLTIDYGADSGLAPLLGFKEDAPYARNCLVRLFRAMILKDELGPIPPEDNDWIERGVAAMLRLPIAERSILRMRQFLGWENPMGAGPRLERWMRGNSLGWVFDNDADRVNFDAPAVGFNLGRVLGDPEVLDIVVQYLNDRIDPVIDGRRAFGVFDEAGNYVDQAENVYRTWRKRNGIAAFATQEPEDFLGSPAGRAVLAQCTSLFFPATPGAHRRIYCGDENSAGLDFSEGEFAAITTRMVPGRHEWLIKRRGVDAESVIIKGDLSPLDPWFLHVLSGTANRVRLWNDLREKFPNALAAFAERSKEVVD